MIDLGTSAPPAINKKLKAALFDGDGVIVKMPDVHAHEVAAKFHGVDLSEINDELFGHGYNQVLRGKMTFKDHFDYLRELWGDHDPKTLVAESLNISIKPEEINYPLLNAIRPYRRQGMMMGMATVQGPERFFQMRQLLAASFDRFFATCEMGRLKVEDSDKDQQTQQLLAEPPADYFSDILSRLGLQPEEVAFFDDRPDNIDIARHKGISAHIYESPEQVAAVLAH
jgi:beta-phosphoglucomutase-like phosphatase (HAD superfamily)